MTWPELYWLTRDTFYEFHIAFFTFTHPGNSQSSLYSKMPQFVANSFGDTVPTQQHDIKGLLGLNSTCSSRLGSQLPRFSVSAPFLSPATLEAASSLQMALLPAQLSAHLAPLSPPYSLQMLPLLGAFRSPYLQAAFGVRAFRRQ